VQPPVDEGRSRFSGLGWTVVVAIVPFGLDVAFRGSLSGWGWQVLNMASLGFCLFALTVAAFVRILEHGNGYRVLPMLFIAVLIQIGFALIYSGTFDRGPTASQRLQVIESALNHGAVDQRQALVLDPETSRLVTSELQALKEGQRQATPSVGIFLAVSGLVGFLALLRYWSPVQSSKKEGDD
jgi:hypothetical protein